VVSLLPLLFPVQQQFLLFLSAFLFQYSAHSQFASFLVSLLQWALLRSLSRIRHLTESLFASPQVLLSLVALVGRQRVPVPFRHRAVLM
jgi:hypothetical protein